MSQEKLDISSELQALEQSGLISTPEKNLRSKIDSIIRSLENLSEKKIRIEFEIQRQKKSLTRKREELKKVSKPSKVKIKIAAEATTLDDIVPSEQELLKLRKVDSMLLQKSNQMLESED